MAVYIIYSADNNESSTGGNLYEDIDLQNLIQEKENYSILKKLKSVGRRKRPSNYYRNPLQLPERQYLEDLEFVRELESNTEEAPSIPERDYLDDTQFVHDLNVELFPIIPELPARCYLEDAEFLADLEEDDSQEASSSLQDSSEGNTEQLFEKDITSQEALNIENSDHKNASSDPDEKPVLSMNAYKESIPAGQYMSLCEATKATQAEGGNNYQEGAYTSLHTPSSEKPEGVDKKSHHHSESDEEPVLFMHADKKPMPAGQYTSLCEATKATQAERGNNPFQEGVYMSLHNTSSEKQESVDKKHSESEYTSLRQGKLSVVDGSSNEQYMSLNESTREKEIFTSGAALRIIQAETGLD